MLELSTLVFRVDSTQLKQAHDLIASLGPAMQGVANASGKVDKATQQAGKATEALGKSADRAAKGLVGVERTIGRQTLKNSILRGETIKLADAQVKLEKAFTPSQAGSLAALQIAGATAAEYRKMATEFKEYNQMVGANKFDDSINGLTKLTKEVEELSLVQKLMADGYQLTAKEIRDLSRDEAVLRQSLEKKQIGEKEYQEKLAFTRQEYIRLSTEKASYIQQSKLAEEQIKREAQAQLRSSAFVGDHAVYLFRQNEAAKKAEIKTAKEAAKAARDAEREKRAEAKSAARAIAEAEAQKQAAIQRTLDLAKNAGRTFAMINRSGQMFGTGPKTSSKPEQQPMDAATNLFYKEQEKQAKDAAKAQQWLTSEMQRTDAVMQEMNNEFGLNAITGERSANAVAKYANALERAGITGVEAAARLETYRNKVQQIAMQDEKRAATRLSRALTPQISDVAVSIAGGMPLHLVIMQQGLQIRDLIAQSGVAAGTLQSVFKTAAADMVKSIGGTIAALGALTFGALVDAGKAVANFGANTTGLNGNLQKLNAQLTASAASGDLLAKSLLRVGALIPTAIGAAIGVTTVAMGAMVYETIKLIGANNELARSLSATQYVFGVGTAGAREYAHSLGELGMSARAGMNLMAQMAATGKLTSADILLVGESAFQMQKWVDVAVEDTVKAFAKMKEKPVEALTELAMKTGQVTPELIKMVKELEQQGKTADAAGIAMKALADQHAIQVKRMQEDLHPLTKAWIGFKEVVSGVWNGVGQIINESMGAVPEQQKLLKDLDNLQRNFKFSKGSGQAVSNFDGRTYEQEQARITNRLSALRRENETKLIASELNRKQLAEDKKRDEARGKYASREEQRAKALADLEANKSRISAAAYQESKKRIEEQFKDKGAEKAAASAVAYEKSAVEKLNDAYNESIGKVQGLTKVEKALSDIRDDPKYKQGSATYRKGIEDYAEALLGQEKAELEAKEAEEAANKVREKSVELRNQQVEAANKLILATQQSITGIDSQIKDVDFNASVFGLSPELERKLRSEYELKKKYETAGLEFYKEVETAKSTTSGEMLQEQLQQLGVKYQRSIELAQKQAELENKTLTDQQKRIQGFDAVFKQGFESMSDKMIEFAATGEASFGDMIQSMLMELAKLELKMQMMKMYESMGGGSEGGILGTLFGMFTGVTQAKGGAWNNGVQMFAKGGVVNRTTAFGMQGGMGVMGEAGPEAIMPLKRGRDGSLGVSGGSGTNVQVFVNNYSQAQVQKKETVDSRGNRRVEVTVGDMTAGEIQRNGSSAQRSIGSTFGIQPVLKNR